jgi:hypothetical protein
MVQYLQRTDLIHLSHPNYDNLLSFINVCRYNVNSWKGVYFGYFPLSSPEMVFSPPATCYLCTCTSPTKWQHIKCERSYSNEGELRVGLECFLEVPGSTWDALPALGTKLLYFLFLKKQKYIKKLIFEYFFLHIFWRKF